MGILPWRDSQSAHQQPDRDDTMADDPLVACDFQDGVLAVYDDGIHINRKPPSKFDDKWIPHTEIRSVHYEKRIVISYLQIQQEGFENDTASMLNTPVDANTLHLGRGKRECAKDAKEAIQAQLETISTE